MKKLLLALLIVEASFAATLTHGPMVGHTTDASTRIWVRADGPAELLVRLQGPGGHTAESAPLRLREEDNFCGTAVVRGLSPRTAYSYQIVLDGVAVEPATPQTVRTFPRPGEPSVITIAFGHSLWGSGEQIVWKAVAAKKPDLLLLMGDNIYSNSTDPAKQRPMYLAYRADPYFRALAATTPVYAIWDDHDFGIDNSDRTQPGKRRSLKTFNELWPNPPAAAPPGAGIWTKFSIGQAEFYLLDVRYHRSPDSAPDTPRKTMLGGAQRDWLIRSLAASKAMFKFPVSGSSWNCGGRESWNHRFVHEYDSILAGLRAARVEGVILLGGDQHQCKIGVRPRESWAGYDLHEWMAGRLWSGQRAGQSHGFGLITIDTTAQPPTARLAFFDHDGASRTGTRVLYTTPGALRAMWDSPAGSLGTPPRSADGELRSSTSGAIWDAQPTTTGETLTLDDLRFPPTRP